MIMQHFICNHMEPMKAESLQLKSLYSEARELEKKVTVLMIELEQHHQQCITEISKAVGKKIKAIQKYEKEKIEQIDLIRTDAYAVVNQEWQAFQKYAQEIRKIYLGGTTGKPTPKFKINTVRSYVEVLEEATNRLDSIVLKAGQSLTSEGSIQLEQSKMKEILSLNAFTVQSETLIDKTQFEPSFQFSPIKRKANAENLLPEKDNEYYEKTDKAKKSSPTQENPQKEPDRFLDSKRSSKHEQFIKNIDFPYSKLKSRQTPYLGESLSKRQGLLQVNIQSDFKSIREMKSSDKVNMGSEMNSVRSNKSRLSKVKSEQKLQSGYKNCLQILQGQQLRYDRIKYGSN